MSNSIKIDGKSSSRRSSFQNTKGTESPFRQASLRLGSPINATALSIAGSPSPHLTNIDFEHNRSFSRGSYDVVDSRSNSFVQRGFEGGVAIAGGTSGLTAKYGTNAPSGLSGLISSSVASSKNLIPSTEASRAPSILSIDNPDPEVVKVVGRHLVREGDASPSLNNDEDSQFDSLKLQGGDITRQLYNWQREHEEGESSAKRGRSRSFDIPRPLPAGPDGEPLNIQEIMVPGGFRRNFIANKVSTNADPLSASTSTRPAFLTRNFIEFLSIYGHFAGEELEEEEDEEESEEEPSEISERTALLRSPRSKRTVRTPRPTAANATATKAVLLLLKSFVGTGVLFLPKAYYNGGILFSTLVLAFVAVLSYWCFLLLIRARTAVGKGSFGDIGGALYGPRMRQMILFSIVLSQIGFAAAYIVFTSENLQAFILSVTDNKTYVNIETLIFVQLIIFLPLSMIRDIAKLSGTALVADLFIMLGLLYLYYWGAHIVITEGIADVKLFNRQDWTLFIGTAIFTYEGIGLIIPIQESMKHPHQFTPVLAGVMIGISLLFVSMGALSYAAYGSGVQTVVILNLPQDSKFVNAVQFLYSLAILLSTPLQLFPAIRIMENGLFVRSGKYNSKIKWEKNLFRFCVVFLTAFVAWGGADDLDRFVALTGSFACIPLVYVYPPLLHFKGVAKTNISKLSDIILFTFGIIAMTYTTYGTLSSWIRNN